LAITCDPFAFETIKQLKNKEKNQDIEIHREDEGIALDGEGYYIDNEGIACTLVTINKVRLLAIGILSKQIGQKNHTHS
jgi:hypothetical protein